MYLTQAITLWKKNIGESDREYCFFTKKFGKILVIAKGIRKPNAKLQGQIEPPCLTNINFITGYNNTLTGALIKNNFPKIRTSCNALQTIQHILKLVDQYILFPETDLDLWNILKQTLDILEKTKDKDTISLLIEYWFEAQLIKHLGFKPLLKETTTNKANINKQTLRSLQILFQENINDIIKNGLAEPILNQKNNIQQYLNQLLCKIIQSY